MWYLITAGAGVLLGLGLLIWGLAERSTKHEAETKAMTLGVQVKIREERVKWLQNQLNFAKQEQVKTEEALAVTRGAVSKLREQLVKHGGPEAIKHWLDEELGDSEV